MAPHARPRPAPQASAIGMRRLRALGAEPLHARTPSGVVAALGAVQAQDPAGARWAVALRAGEHAGSAAAIDAALDAGSIVRTHVLRGTWQLVAPADLRWLLALVAPRVLARAARRHAELGLDARTLARCGRFLEDTLRDEGPLTREAVATRLHRAGLPHAGPPLSHLLAVAELEARICSGPRTGGHDTYATVEARVPPVDGPLDPEAGAARLATRYFASRGPATLADFVWWSGLAAADARRAIEAAAPALRAETHDGVTHWTSDSIESTAPAQGAPERPPDALLLPAFDEFLVSYRDRDAVLDPAHARAVNAGGGMLDPCVVVRGRVVGVWRRTFGKGVVTVELAPFEPLAPGDAEAVEAAAARYARFVGHPLALRTVPRIATRSGGSVVRAKLRAAADRTRVMR